MGWSKWAVPLGAGTGLYAKTLCISDAMSVAWPPAILMFTLNQGTRLISSANLFALSPAPSPRGYRERVGFPTTISRLGLIRPLGVEDGINVGPKNIHLSAPAVEGPALPLVLRNPFPRRNPGWIPPVPTHCMPTHLYRTEYVQYKASHSHEYNPTENR
ncbi:hypothetical protein B0H66DRAFT_536261 [Apodospora peruviana]|uniref:Uncharacterized protein n=1 Tax=Apodospora peruviana TaxID=516989 RepID=A0AAE0M187_9PEZI|nr:hypothetical protein B0H66DRAFT_219558 [Apodospora peruviana]KAK3315392.1 hypothetical protein B0H66DRAFT_536261 [Apodospora peruviana]